MTILLIAFYFGILSLLLARWKWVKNSGIRINILLILFAIKVLVGFALVYLYGHFYNPEHSDIYIYYNDAIYLKEIFSSQRDTFWDLIFNREIGSEMSTEVSRNLNYWHSSRVDWLIHEKRIVILLNFLFSFVSFSHIYIHSLFMAFIGFLGQIAIFRFVKRQSAIHPVLILIISFLLPTFLLWSSSILKEPLIVFSMGMLLFFVGKWTKKWKIKYLITLSVFYAIGLIIKPYVILSLSFPIIFFVFFKFKNELSFKKQSLIVASSGAFILLLFWTLSFSSFNLFQKLANKQADFYKTIALAEENQEVGSKIDIDILEPNLRSLAFNSPKAFSNVMFKPGIFDFKNLLYLPDIFQNVLLLLISFLMLKKYRTPNIRELPLLWLSILFVIILFTTIGLVTPVLGAIVRYKIPALIFVFFFLFSFLDSSFIDNKAQIFFFKKK